MGSKLKLLAGAVLAVVLLATAGTWVYINVIRDEAPDRLTLDAGGEGPAAPATAATTPPAQPAAGSAGGLDGTWRVTGGSQAGYRVDEILFGQKAVAVGRTNDVTGEFRLGGTTVTSGRFSVDMATVRSDESRRDNQFRGRIMDVARYPTATFELAEPLRLGSLPPDGRNTTVTAAGDLTLRGTTKRVAVELSAEREGDVVRVAGSVPIVFEKWGIPNPSFGPADTEDHGELEFLLVFEKAA